MRGEYFKRAAASTFAVETIIVVKYQIAPGFGFYQSGIFLLQLQSFKRFCYQAIRLITVQMQP